MSLDGENCIKTCNRCGKLFVYLENGLKICEACKEQDEKEFQTVKDYIYNNPSATFKDTVLATGVKGSRVRSYLKTGRLIIPDTSLIFINCENCGISIKFGRICTQCANTLSNEMKKEMCIEEYHVGESPKRAGWYATAFSNR